MKDRKQYVVRSLTCKRDLEMAIICYRSLLSQSEQNIKLVIHSDGSLSEADIEEFYKSLNNVEVIDRKDREEEIKEILCKHPNCLKFRHVHPLSNKIIDIPLIEKNCLRFVDGDILFIKKFDELFSDDCTSRFCLEDDTAYSGRLVDMIKASSNRIPKGCNTGIIQMNIEKFDLDYIEWFLSQKPLCTFPGMLEQTLYAIFMGWQDSYHYKFDQISTSKKRINVSEKTIALHFMYDLKKNFFEVARKYNNSGMEIGTSFQLSKPERLSYPYIIKRSLLRRLATN